MYYLKDPCMIENENVYAQYGPVRFLGIFRMSMENVSIMAVGLPFLTLLFRREIPYALARWVSNLQTEVYV